VVVRSNIAALYQKKHLLKKPSGNYLGKFDHIGNRNPEQETTAYDLFYNKKN